MFPANPQNSQMVADKYGNVYQYFADIDSWINLGIQIDPGEATENRNGLVIPDVYSILQEIQNLKNTGVDFSKTRLTTSCSPYFYYFYSPDNTIKFQPYNNYLQIEVNKPYLNSLLIRNPCIGVAGPKGLPGLAGKNGKPAKNETFHILTEVSGIKARILATVDTPIDTGISLRIYNATQTLILTIFIQLDGTITYINTDNYVIDESKSKIIFTNNKLNALIVLSKGHFDKTFRYKARQIGPKGKTGKNGNGFLEITTEIINPLVEFGDVITTISKTSDNIQYSTESIKTNCSNNLAVSNISSGEYVTAVSPLLKQCKDILYYNFTDEIELPLLSLPNWYADKSCMGRKVYKLQEFDWYKNAIGDNEVCGRGIGVPYIITGDLPDRLCCKRDLFICRNIGDDCPIDLEISSQEWETTDSGSISSEA